MKRYLLRLLTPSLFLWAFLALAPQIVYAQVISPFSNFSSPSDSITVTVTDLDPAQTYGWRESKYYGGSVPYRVVYLECFRPNPDGTKTFQVGPFTSGEHSGDGIYEITIHRGGGPLGRCEGQTYARRVFLVGSATPVPGITSRGNPGPTIKPDCPTGSSSITPGIETALGCIPTQNTTEFIKWLLRWAIGIAGGIAFILILWSGFKILTSAGNPDSLKAGQEQLTAAISGLLFILFSVFLLRLIGLDILQIPGFGTP